MDAAPHDDFGIRQAPLSGRPRFASPRVEALWTWWAGARRDGIVPLAAFDIVQHAALTPYLFVLHRVEDGFERRLYGEEARRSVGLDHHVRGQRIGPGYRLPPGQPAGYGQHLSAYYAQVLASGTAWRCAGYLPFAHRTHVRFESIDAPVSRGGAEPDAILGLIDRVG